MVDIKITTQRNEDDKSIVSPRDINSKKDQI